MNTTIIRKIAIISICILVIFAVFAMPFVEKALTETTITVVVTDKGIKRYDDADKYLIYTDNGTYEITDTIAYWRWNSSDLYGEIQIGETYEMKVFGFRIPFFSSYKNIIKAEIVSE